MISNSDLEKLNKAVNGIAAVQSELSPEELSAFNALILLLNSGNFESGESGGYIRVIKNDIPQHGNNRLLQVHLKNYIALCEKYFKQSDTGGKTKSSRNSTMQILIVVGIIIAVGYFMVKDSDWFNNHFSKEKAEIEQIEVVAKTNEEGTLIIDENLQAISMKSATTDEGMENVEISKEQKNISSTLSNRLLTENDLRGLSKQELRILRNEIFARHGYIFQTQEMKTYFQNQSWYSPRYNNVNSMLTDIEQKNIAFIKRHE